MTLPDEREGERRAPTVDNPDAPLRLADAAAIAFPGDTMTASGLRREAARGRLAIERIAGKDYTTLRAIEEMRRLCRVEQKERASTRGTAPAESRSGSSEMDRTKRAQALGLIAVFG